MATIPTIPRPARPEQYEKDRAAWLCADRYRGETANLETVVDNTRRASILAVFDSNAEHANAVFDLLGANGGPTRGQLIGEDVAACVMIRLRRGEDPGSPVPEATTQKAGMALVPSDPAQYLADVAAIDAAFARIAAQSYQVVDVPKLEA